ncbi:hypothetical protein FN846DRAFT_329200 [Sphaerosporella brunnea]|uniref:BAH domain-containing protein n=1 Tax=Sphaerosporella brunnea TaxID=1250544 RepID=A0A5J5EJJ9_9PEZI|nr:hypothetical protein FN846DRAFT_329200 [Sphaerosporella brunnea]
MSWEVGIDSASVGTETFSVNDFVFINHTNIPHSTELANIDDKDFWVARVLEIRAKDEAHVYLRVYWMYWPDELPNKRQSYHGARELLASNHMEIVDAMTVSGRAHVTHWLELDEEEDIPGLFWRQKFDWPTSQLSELRTHCRCHKHYNPDSLLVNCSACGVWLHAECVIDDIKTRVLERGGPPEEEVVNKEDSIAVAKPAPPPTKRKGAKTLFSSAVESFVPVNPLEAPETPKAEKNAVAPGTPKAEKTTAAPETPKAERTATAPPMSIKKRSAKEMKSEKEKIKVTYNDTTSKAHVRDLRGTAEAATPGKRRKGPAGSAAPAPLGEAKEWDEEVKCLCCGAVVV